MNLIAISGKISSGKDTVGKIIQELDPGSNWEVRKFADKLKEIVAILIGVSRADLEKDEVKNMILPPHWDRWELRRKPEAGGTDKIIRLFASEEAGRAELEELLFPEHFTLAHVQMTPRLILQLLGTEGGRKIIHPSIWINATFSGFDMEIWKQIGETDYYVSSYGRVKSKNGILKATPSGDYLTVGVNGQTKLIHTLVADAFVSGKNHGFVVDHIDFDKKNNFYKNLQWTTNQENISRNKEYGKHAFGEKQGSSKLTDEDVLVIKRLFSEGVSGSAIAKAFDISTSTISQIKNGKKWSHVGREIKTVKPILPPKWLMTDCRFVNEAESVKSRGGIVIRVERPGMISTSTHESETALDDYNAFDELIINDGSLSDLKNKVEKLLFKYDIL